MNTYFKCLITIAILFGFSSSAFTADNTVSREEFLKIIKKMEQMEQKYESKINNLTSEIETLKTREQTRQDVDVTVLEEDVEELSELMQVVERKSMLDRVQLSAELRTRCDWFDFKEQVPVSSRFGGRSYNSHHEEEVHALMSNRLRLNLKSQVSDNLKFSGRLVMYKNWNNSSTGYTKGIVNPYGYTSARRPEDVNLLVERAYADYFFNLGEKFPMALTFGRLPTTDGMPTELRDNTPRKSTYPSISFDMASDGVALSLGLDKLTGLKQSALRLIYARIVEDNENRIYNSHESGVEDGEYYIAQFETMLPGKYFEDIMFVTNFLYFPEVPLSDLSNMQGGALELVEQHHLGDSHGITFYLQSLRYMGSNFDWFAGLRLNRKRGPGSPAVYKALGLFDVPFQFEDENDHAWYVGFRYNIPCKALNNPKIGVEYNHGSKYYLSNSSGSDDPLDKLNQSGSTWDIYYIQPITKNLTTRIGYTRLNRDYVDGAISPVKKVDQEITNMYFLLDAKFF
ncbi:MAG: DUF3373 family protein [Deltaproteobacteria bacterium]|nr:DUF3373 family protein [Deltaproteobacteria bacterium]